MQDLQAARVKISVLLGIVCISPYFIHGNRNGDKDTVGADKYRDNDEWKQAGGCPQTIFQFIAEIEDKGEEQHGYHQYKTGEYNFVAVLVVVLKNPRNHSYVITAQKEIQHGKEDVAVGHETVIKESQQSRERQDGNCTDGVAYQPLVAQQGVFLGYENA